MDGNPFWTDWYFHVPNFLLAALLYTLLGRLLLMAFVPADWENYIWRAFCRLTDPVLRVVAAITPSMVPSVVLLPLAAFWLMLTRIALYVGLTWSGLQPQTGLG